VKEKTLLEAATDMLLNKSSLTEQKVKDAEGKDVENLNDRNSVVGKLSKDIKDGGLIGKYLMLFEPASDPHPNLVDKPEQITMGYCYGLATPEWSNTNEIPVDISGDKGYETIATIKTPEFEYVQEVKIWYQNNYFETVYRLLTNYINHGDTPGIIDMT
jgi:hypothetical protein